jgi:hypothetical protein
MMGFNTMFVSGSYTQVRPQLVNRIPS